MKNIIFIKFDAKSSLKKRGAKKSKRSFFLDLKKIVAENL
jgi:hypothetical protein